MMMPADPQITITQHGAQLQLASNLAGSQAKLAMYQMLRQAADMAFLELVKEQVQGGERLVQVPDLALRALQG